MRVILEFGFPPLVQVVELGLEGDVRREAIVQSVVQSVDLPLCVLQVRLVRPLVGGLGPFRQLPVQVVAKRCPAARGSSSPDHDRGRAVAFVPVVDDPPPNR